MRIEENHLEMYALLTSVFGDVSQVVIINNISGGH